MAMKALMQARDVNFAYRGRKVINNITLTVRQGEVVSLLGPNGSGKTTLLKILLDLLHPQTGTVLFDDRPLKDYPRHELARRIAYVPQVHREAFAYTVADVVLMGRMPYHSMFSTYSAKDLDIAETAMARLDILSLKNRPYTEISGGERQLALIARALTQGADTLVMDEPANGLDFGNQIRLLDQIADLARDGYTFIMSTHFPEHAFWIADHVVMLQNGFVIADGKPNDVMSEEAIYQLYNTAVSIFKFKGTVVTCVPCSVLQKAETEQNASSRLSRDPLSLLSTVKNHNVRTAEYQSGSATLINMRT